MNARLLTLAVITLLGAARLTGQQAAPKPQAEPVQDVIRKLNQADAEKPREPVVLEPVAAPPAEDSPAGNPLAGQAAPPDPGPPPAPRPGLVLRMETLQAGTGITDAAQVKLLAPFPAKPLAQAPAGWSLKAVPNAPPFTREVELTPGKKITLSIRPHLLVPDADGTTVFSLPEPAFTPALGYRQNATVGAILARSIRQLEDDSKALGTAIDQLQQILVSLPKPPTPAEPPPEDNPAPKAIPAPIHKR